VAPQSLYGRVRISSLSPGFDPPTVQLVASRYTDLAIVAHPLFFFFCVERQIGRKYILSVSDSIFGHSVQMFHTNTTLVIGLELERPIDFPVWHIVRKISRSGRGQVNAPFSSNRCARLFPERITMIPYLSLPSLSTHVLIFLTLFHELWLWGLYHISLREK